MTAFVIPNGISITTRQGKVSESYDVAADRADT